MIDSCEPSDWKALQQDVGRVLEECGFEVVVEAKVTTVRGQVELDVLALSNLDGRRSTVICECKWWDSNIPQTVVHAFRGVVNDFGADTGYLVARRGFQSGARAAAEKTNVRLMTWQEFQEEFEQAWLKNFLVPEITETLDEFQEFMESLPPRVIHEALQKLSDADKQTFLELRDHYLPLGVVMMQFTSYWTQGMGMPVPQLPLRDTLPENADRQRISSSILDATSYRQLYACALNLSTEGMRAMKEALRLS